MPPKRIQKASTEEQDAGQQQTPSQTSGSKLSEKPEGASTPTAGTKSKIQFELNAKPATRTSRTDSGLQRNTRQSNSRMSGRSHTSLNDDVASATTWLIDRKAISVPHPKSCIWTRGASTLFEDFEVPTTDTTTVPDPRTAQANDHPDAYDSDFQRTYKHFVILYDRLTGLSDGGAISEVQGSNFEFESKTDDRRSGVKPMSLSSIGKTRVADTKGQNPQLTTPSQGPASGSDESEAGSLASAMRRAIPLISTSMALDHDQAIKNSSIPEVEARRMWDFIHYGVYVNHRVVSRGVQLEASLSTPRNPIARNILDCAQMKSLELRLKWLEEFRSLYLEKLVKLNAWIRKRDFDIAEKTLNDNSAADSARRESLIEYRQDCLLYSERADKMVTEMQALVSRPKESDAATIILTRSLNEGRTGIVDAFLFESIPGAFVGLTKDQKDRFLAICAPNARLAPPPVNHRPIFNDPLRSTEGTYELSRLEPEEPERIAAQLGQLTLTNPKEPLFNAKEDFTLPIMVAEYKKATKSWEQAINQCRTYLVSLLHFLNLIGITEFPVFGLATNGPIGVVIMGWMTPKEKIIYIMDKNIVNYDLRSLRGSTGYCEFIARLKEEASRSAVFYAEKVKTGIRAFTSLDQAQLQQWEGPKYDLDEHLRQAILTSERAELWENIDKRLKGVSNAKTEPSKSAVQATAEKSSDAAKN